MMDTDHHNFRLPSDWYDKRNQYCCPPMPLKTSLFWDFWQTIWKQMGCPDVNFETFYSELRNNSLRNFWNWKWLDLMSKRKICLNFSRLNFIQIFHKNKLFRKYFFSIFLQARSFLWRVNYELSHGQRLRLSVMLKSGFEITINISSCDRARFFDILVSEHPLRP